MAEHEIYFATASQLRQYKAKKIVTQVLLYGFLTLIGLFIVLPFFYMIITSFKSTDAYGMEQARGELVLWLDQTNFSTEQYSKVLGKGGDFGYYYLNTIIVAVISTAFTTATTVFAAFAFARVEFKGKNAIFMVLMATMMIPGEMMIITNFQTALTFGWKDTYAALIFVHGVSVFYIFYLRQTFQQIPNELFLAAKVDGYGHFSYLFRVMLPIASPTIVTIMILSLMGSWNAYIWPQLIASGKNPNFENDMHLVSNGLMAKFQSSEFSSDDPAKICGSMFATVPLFIFFLCFRKYIMRGVSRSGIKG
ncbi:MAG: carbohydrate ABC transporter permease [Erysipelotrichaceae bacterium]|jgi:multiple sugar transport system permease protein|nr:carbohydrate ABC transporter permease [Erysipelotrichaceae bacterium]